MSSYSASIRLWSNTSRGIENRTRSGDWRWNGGVVSGVRAPSRASRSIWATLLASLPMSEARRGWKKQEGRLSGLALFHFLSSFPTGCSTEVELFGDYYPVHRAAAEGTETVPSRPGLGEEEDGENGYQPGRLWVVREIVGTAEE